MYIPSSYQSFSPMTLSKIRSATASSQTVYSKDVGAVNIKSSKEIPNVESNLELYHDIREVVIDVQSFFIFGKATTVLPTFTIHLTPLTYLPKVDEPRRDWVASVAVPAFMAHREDSAVRRFVTIGTGSGLDAIAALDIFDLESLAITDLHPVVVQTAASNIKAATAGCPSLTKAVESLVAHSGDLLTPLKDHEGQALHSGQASSTYAAERYEQIPAIANDSLLALHWLALVQAKTLLAPGGAVLSSMGGRVPLAAMLEMARSAGYVPQVLTYTWKIQSEPEEVIGGYNKNQEDGTRPFYFYLAEVLEREFAGITPLEGGRVAAWIEQQLAPYRLDAVVAYEAHKTGIIIGHTVAVVRSVISDVQGPA
ncbi:hypothetical protein PILCRDRAFT_4194 [Piloderma croceum F 1598]|uniref:Uncharacterized protein n=1 Tax=Piloderma croceum (strain F 1598) TaxID=765440 RepID=A0A0C3G8G8_PILCF|nr:hypothetical protein PILCRDRAFT_4194 [Piloderma croceum F 1598]